ncbi:Holliday junction resolvase RuvX [Thermosynechococcaceae cyanobacterium BACA0444]|uniref:Putative pre-16S rRNA nuclease n=1 Tax=Pseudocalidococcus azoricus BACA0444 TaxID=2918990 RepID=A0AAE4FQK8_9CYAN|nr:Holliday junction resolvase RuvX [Pseudocalidococcus azoricus]MDS3859702.1 Holliday junction resolvase RuvX [Pseudocalidococcus azoricus BACA0444]
MISALGLDFGRKRIGLAACDQLGLIAFGLKTLIHRSFAEDAQAIGYICQQREVKQLVVGLPLMMNGEIGTQARHVQRWGERLGQVLNLPVVFVDERLTSYQAEEMLRQRGYGRHSQRQRSTSQPTVDSQAAAIILQQWLDQQRSGVTAKCYAS